MNQNRKNLLLFALPTILVSLFSVLALILAWTEPTQAPPQGNVPAPINVGTTTQYKQGALGIGGVLQVYGGITTPVLTVSGPNVGIGTITPTYKLDVSGDINASGVYRKGGIAGVSVSCGSGTTPSGITISGGIVTSAGSCTPIGGGGESYWTLSGSNLYPNNTNWNVGIGTTNPDRPLRVRNRPGLGDLHTAFFENTAGYGVGIGAKEGTTYGTLQAWGGGRARDLVLQFSGGNVGIGTVPLQKLHVKNGDTNLVFNIDSSVPDKVAIEAFNEPNTVKRDILLNPWGGNVGIGTTNPTQKLDVAGYVKGTGLCIGSDCRTSWPSGGGSLKCTVVTCKAPYDGNCTVTCPEGYTVTGGGVRSTASDKVYWLNSYPDGNGWRCGVDDMEAICYAVCCKIE